MQRAVSCRPRRSAIGAMWVFEDEALEASSDGEENTESQPRGVDFPGARGPPPWILTGNDLKFKMPISHLSITLSPYLVLYLKWI